MNVLLIEDHPELRAMMAGILSECGHAVTARATGTRGQEAYSTGDFPIVLVDLGLPDMSGHDFVRWLRTTANGAFSVVLVITGQHRPDDLRAALDAGADDFLTKPFSIDQFKIRLTVAEREADEHRLRRQAQDALAASEKRYRELYAAAKRQAQELSLIDRVRTAITRRLEPHQVFQAVVEGITSTFGYTHVALLLRDGDRLILRNHVGYASLPTQFSINEGIVGKVVRTGAPVFLPNVADDPSYISVQPGIVSEICVPLQDAGKVVGAINVETTGEQRLTERDLALLTAVGDQVGLAIAQTRLYAELRGSEERFRALVQHASDIILVLNAQGKVTSASPSVRYVLGYPPETLIGRSNSDLIYPEDRSILRRTFRAAIVAPNETQRAEMRFRHNDGTFRWLEIVASNLLTNPHIAGIVVNARDATQRKQTEQELTDALAAQQEANQELERLNRLKTDFVSVVSHEFRTPLTSICGFSELLATDDMPNDQVREFAGLINSEALRLDRLIGDILDLNRMESGRFSIRRTYVDLRDVIAKVVEQIRLTAPKHTFSLIFDGDQTAIWADTDKVTQVMTNLLSNAVKYAPDGGEITIKTALANGWAHVQISDQGIGIPNENLEAIFDRYIRIENGVTRQIIGTGLGLAIVRQIAEMHGGRVWAESTLGLGSTFHLELPIDRRSSETGFLTPRVAGQLLATGALTPS